MAKKQTFETASAELESIIKSMESNDLPLGDAIKNYAKGMKLVEFCRKELDRAQAAVDKLVQEDGSLEDIGFPGDEDYVNFDADGGEEDDGY